MDTPRRQFLRGTGGFALGLPLLPSLLPRTARAATGPRYFASMFSHHGNVSVANMHPPASTFSNKTEIFPKHFASWGNLQRQVSGEDAMISPVLRAKATALTSSVVSKMNTYLGLDIPFNIGHHTGGVLGNYNRTDTGPAAMAIAPRATLDQVLAWSPSFYPDLTGVRMRSLVMGGNFRGVSWNWSNPANRTGTIQSEPVISAARAFTQIFTPGQAMVPMQKRAPIVDRILANYRTLRQSNRRLSINDRQRLDDHMQRLLELQRNITAIPSVNCSGITRSPNMTDLIGPDWTSLDQLRQVYRGVTELIAAAFICGGSRVASINVTGIFTDYTGGGSWHQDVAHLGDTPTNQALLAGEQRLVFANMFMDLATRLDVDDGTGKTFLDNAVIQWMQEAGPATHNQQSTPVITAGSAGGFFKTGRAFDYRNQVTTSYASREVPLFTGITYNRWMATTLQALGLPPSEWEYPGEKGFGSTYVADGYNNAYGANLNAILASASDILPFVNA